MVLSSQRLIYFLSLFWFLHISLQQVSAVIHDLSFMSHRAHWASPLNSKRGFCYWITRNIFQNDCENNLLLCIHDCLLHYCLCSPRLFISTAHLPVSSASASKSFLPTPQHPYLYQATHPIVCFLFSFFFHTEAPGFVTLDHSLRYYPSITYGVIGSAIIFVLVVALLALVLHHQRKRSVLLPRSVRGSTHHHQPLLLSRLVILDRGHANARGLGLSPGSSNAAGHYTATPQALHLLSGAMYPSSVSLDSPPSYSESVLDVR